MTGSYYEAGDVMNKGIATFIIVIFTAVFIAAFRKSKFSFSVRSEPEHQITEFKLEEIEIQLDTVNRIMNRINDLENLITDIEVCDPEKYMKNLTVNWADDEDGSKSHYDFFLTGDNFNTEMILKMAYVERKKLRSLLIKEIRNLAERSYENCYENYPNLSRGGNRNCRNKNIAKAAEG